MTRAVLAACLLSAACAGGPARPADLAMGEDACAQCRMVIVSQAAAAQIVAPGEETRFFDEIGCLRTQLGTITLAPDAAVFVADHRTGHWVDAREAIFTRTGAATPMASGVLAHADVASRDADAAARGGEPVPVVAILGPFAVGAGR